MKYYYCVDLLNKPLYINDMIVTHFLITPAEYYDRTGFLEGREKSVLSDDLPIGFNKVSHSVFEYLGSTAEGLEVLKATKGFIQRDMEKEIREKHENNRGTQHEKEMNK